MPKRSSVDTLDPKSVTVTVEDREYTQHELSLRQTGRLFEFVAALLVDPDSGINLAELVNIDINSSEGMAALVGKIVRLGPSVLSRLLAILLNAPDDAEWLADNLTPRAALEILCRGVEQNDLPSLLRDFFCLRAEITTAVKEARKS